jgi:hypothetical protein
MDNAAVYCNELPSCHVASFQGIVVCAMIFNRAQSLRSTSHGLMENMNEDKLLHSNYSDAVKPIA